MDAGKWAFSNRKLLDFLIVVLVAGGLWGAYAMSKFEDPEIKVKVALVSTVCPGLSASEVELEVTDPIEKEIRQMSDVYNIESYSYNDLSIIQVELLSTVPKPDVEQHWDELRRKVSDATSKLPAGCREPEVHDGFSDVYGIFLALTGDGMDDVTLGKYADLIKRELLEIDGIDKVTLYGKQPECINIRISQSKIASLGVKPAEIFATLKDLEATPYSGYYDNGDTRARVNVCGRFTEVSDIRDMLVAGHQDDNLRLSDIATVEKEFETPVRNEMLYDGERSIGILVSANTGSDIIKVGGEVSRTLERLAAERFPAGVTVNKVFYQPDKVGGSLSVFFVNLAESVGIVILILMLAMGFRSGVVIAVSLVTIVLGSFLFLFMLGGTMQRVSLGAFILAMGMLVDNAIVIVDGILVDLNAGKSRREAMTAIGRKTCMPLLGATLIAILAFFPIFLSPDTPGVYVRDLFIVLAVSLLLSWILALVHVPLMCDSLFRHKTADGGDMYKGRIYAVLRSTLGWGLSHRLSTVALMAALLVGSILCFRWVKQGFFPDMEYDQMYIEYKLPEATNSSRVKSDLALIETDLKEKFGARHVTTSIGATPGRYNLVRNIATPSLSYGELIVDFDKPSEVSDKIEDIQHYLTDNYPEAYAKAKKYNLMFKKFPIEAQITGPDPAVLSQIGDSIKHLMEHSGIVRIITRDLEPPTPVIDIHYDRPSAIMSGVTRNDLSLSLLTANGGLPVSTFYDGLNQCQIYVKETDEEGNDIADIENMPVFTMIPDFASVADKATLSRLMAGKVDKDEIMERLMAVVPLRQAVSDVTVDWEYPVIPRFNGQRMIRVQASPIEGLETSKAQKQIAGILQSLQLPEGYALSWQGEKAASDQAMRYLFLNFPLAIILMIAILIMLFKDYRKPVIILCTVPMVAVGVVLTMAATRQVFNFCAIVGTLGLIGMVIKNGIVLLDEINIQVASGKPQREALISAAQSRLRPVAMAALTTILGMLPLLADAMFGAMAAAIMGGLLFGSIVTLLFIPVLYSLFFNKH